MVSPGGHRRTQQDAAGQRRAQPASSRASQQQLQHILFDIFPLHLSRAPFFTPPPLDSTCHPASNMPCHTPPPCAPVFDPAQLAWRQHQHTDVPVPAPLQSGPTLCPPPALSPSTLSACTFACTAASLASPPASTAQQHLPCFA